MVCYSLNQFHNHLLYQYNILLNFIKEKRKKSKFDITYGCSHFLGMKYEKEVRNHMFFCIAGFVTASILYNGDIMRILKNYNEIITYPYSNNHEAIDVVGNNNGVHVLDYITAYDKGKVVEIRKDSVGFEDNGSYGNYVLIDHGNDLKTRYAHLNTVNVNINDIVNRGDILGYMGETGYAFGGHLHFEMIKNGKKIDPTKYIFEENPRLIFTCPEDGIYYINLNKDSKLYYKN